MPDHPALKFGRAHRQSVHHGTVAYYGDQNQPSLDKKHVPQLLLLIQQLYARCLKFRAGRLHEIHKQYWHWSRAARFGHHCPSSMSHNSPPNHYLSLQTWSIPSLSFEFQLYQTEQYVFMSTDLNAANAITVFAAHVQPEVDVMRLASRSDNSEFQYAHAVEE